MRSALFSISILAAFLGLVTPRPARADDPLDKLSWLVGSWDFDDAQVDGDYRETGTRICERTLDDEYIVCESHGTSQTGKVRTYRFYISYNDLDERYEMLSIFGDYQRKLLHPMQVSEDGRHIELETHPWAAEGLTTMNPATIVYDGADGYTWGTRTGEPDPVTGVPAVGFRDVVTRRAPRPATLEEVVALRLRGELGAARALAARAMAATGEPTRRVALRIELARIHDRVGLHTSSRPVEAALDELTQAEEEAQRAGAESRAQLELAKGVYFYRAEMAERSFPRALSHVERALEAFEALSNLRGQADAVHQLGLIRLQQRDLPEARRLFDASLELERRAGERATFRGDYERHVAFTYLFADDPAGALPHLERSLFARREAGAVDQAAFAASSLASVLVELERPDEAVRLASYAVLIAERIDSPFGRAQFGLVLARAYEAAGDPDAAIAAYESALESAVELGLDGARAQARSAIDRLSSR